MEQKKDATELRLGSDGAGQARDDGGPKEDGICRIGPVRVRDFVRPKVRITQNRLRAAAEYQAIAWQAEEVAHVEIQSIARDLSHGGEIEAGSLFYDSDLKMVRTRKAEREA